MYAQGTGETRAGADAAPARLRTALAEASLRQRGGLVHWVPVCLAAGIGAWFSLPVEPGVAVYAGLAALAACALWAAARVGEAASPLCVAVALACLGAGAAGLRAHAVAAPVLEFRYYGAVEGRIVDIDRSASGALRLTLDRVRLDDVSRARTPGRVRLSLYGEQGYVVPAPGLVVMTTAHLSPPGGPVEPGGFDFARMAWFDGLGAVGYTRVPVLMAAPTDGGRVLAVARLRAHLSAAIRADLPGARGAFAAAILTGDRSAIPEEPLENLRSANLAHLLAISGLHMGLLTGAVFAAVRGGLALVPGAALRLPCKKIAALVALGAGAFYLALSGGSVATVRAFVMVAVMLVAVLLDRRAISLRSVAIAASLVLLMTPEALSGPGFQMSFAATVALVAVYQGLRGRDRALLPRWALPLAALFVTSAVAGAATAPFAAAHFNRFTDYGLIANLAAVPVMGTLVMPAALAAAVLAPFGLADLGLQVMGLGLGWILWVAEAVTALDGSTTPVPAPGPGVLPALSLGALFLLLWRGHGRWLGLVPVLAAGILWAGVERPAILIAPSGGLVGVMGAEGRALSKPRGDGFAASVWLENDGDAAPQAVAATRPGLSGPPGDRTARVGDIVLRHVTGRGRDARAAGACTGDILVVNTELARRPPGPCRLYDTARLRETGAVAVYPTETGMRIVHAADRSAGRLWHAR